MSNETVLEAEPQKLGARLREARAARGLTQAQVGEKLGVARTTMVAIEKGERVLRPEELLELARVYGRKLSELLRPSDPVADLAVQLRGSLPPDEPTDPDLLQRIEELEKLCDDYLELERLCSAPLLRRDPPIYSLDEVAPESVAEEVASQERNRLGLGEAPILNLRALLEGEVGIRVFCMDLPSSVAGMYSFGEEHGGVIVVNGNHPQGRRRHAMAHEYGHFLTERYQSEVTIPSRYSRRPRGERFAESFGRAFLMPPSAVKRRFHDLLRQHRRKGSGGVTPAELCQMADFFAVSFEAMTKRLEELGLLRDGTWQSLDERGFRPRDARKLLGLEEPDREMSLFSARYQSLAVEAWLRGVISEGQLAAFLHTDRVSARRLAHAMEGAALGSGEDVGMHAVDLFSPLSA